MSRSFDLATGPNYSINSVGSCGAVGNGAYTIIVLFNIASGNNSAGLISFRAAGINAQLMIDTNQLFGANDFGGGQTGVTVSTWWWAAIRKAAGTNVYRYSLRQYNTGSTTHQNSVATFADSGVTNTSIRLADGDDRGNGLIAVWAAWTSNLSDGTVAGMFTTAASDVAAQSPQGLWLGNQASSSDPINDSAGSANQTSVNGAIGVGSDPPSYSYSLSGSTAVWIPVGSPRRRTQPPRRRPRAQTPTRPQVNPPFPFLQVHQPRQPRGFLPKRARIGAPVPPQVVIPVVPRQQVRPRLRLWFQRRGRAGAPVPAQAAVTTPPPYPIGAVRARLRGVRLFRGRAATPVPAQVVVAVASYPLQALRARVRGLRAFRGRSSAPPVDQVAPIVQQRLRLKLPKLFRPRIAQTVPPQISVAPPPYAPQNVRARLRLLRAFRSRTATVVPPQIVVAPPAYVPPNVRARIRGLRLFRGRSSGVVPPQIIVAASAVVAPNVRSRLKWLRWPRPRPAAPPVAQAAPLIAPRVRPHPAAPRRGRSFSPPMPQPVVPPANPPQPVRGRPKGLRLGRQRNQGGPTPAQVVVIAPPFPPSFARFRKRIARMFRGASRLVPVTAPVVAARPPTVTVDLARAVATADLGRSVAVADASRPVATADLTRTAATADLTRPSVTVAL